MSPLQKQLASELFCGLETTQPPDRLIPSTGAAILGCTLLISVVSDTRDLVSVKAVHNVYTLSGNPGDFCQQIQRMGNIKLCFIYLKVGGKTLSVCSPDCSEMHIELHANMTLY